MIFLKVYNDGGFVENKESLHRAIISRNNPIYMEYKYACKLLPFSVLYMAKAQLQNYPHLLWVHEYYELDIQVIDIDYVKEKHYFPS